MSSDILPNWIDQVANLSLNSSLGTLPTEILAQVCTHLDISSVCALSQSFICTIPNHIFEYHLSQVCPWFEPALSHRKTWRDCALEYVRRSKPGVTFVKDVKVVSEEEFGEVPVIQESLQKPLETKGNIYTSEHGITVNLKGYSLETEDDFEPSVVSLPHMLLILCYGSMSCCGGDCYLIVKYKDSEGDEPDVKRTVGINYGPVNVHVRGRHIFLRFLVGECSEECEESLHYFDGETLTCNLKSTWENYPPNLLCYDGLIQYLDFNQQQFVAVQTGLEGTQGENRISTKHLLTVDRWWCQKDLVDETGRYTVVHTEDGKEYMFDAQRRVLVLRK